MSLSRICATTLGLLALGLAGSSFATGEDTPLPGDFQPPALTKNARKPGNSNNGSIAPATSGTSNIPPKQSMPTELNANSTVKARPAKDTVKPRHTAARTKNAHKKTGAAKTGPRLGIRQAKAHSTNRHARQKLSSIVDKKAAVRAHVKNKGPRSTVNHRLRTVKTATAKHRPGKALPPKPAKSKAAKASRAGTGKKAAQAIHHKRKH